MRKFILVVTALAGAAAMLSACAYKPVPGAEDTMTYNPTAMSGMT